MRLSVIIPAYNESKGLGQTIAAAYDWLGNTLPGDFELLVVDDGSDDGTGAVVEKMIPEMPLLRLLKNQRNLGKGAAVRRGMLESVGDVRLFMDADHSTRINEVEKVFNEIANGADVVIASRQHSGSKIPRRQSLLRQRMGMFFNYLVRKLTGLSWKDTQCGFKAFTAEAAEAIFRSVQLDGFSFDVEVLLAAAGRGMKVREIPVEWTNSPNSRVHILSDSWKMFVDLFRLRKILH